ncbi:MAG: caspase family protein, partial [Pseudomonadota bacterium]
MIAFSTAPGYQAADGTGDNSPYTDALAQLITLPGIPAEIMFKRVADRVKGQTRGAQIPFYNSGLTGEDFCFAGCLDTQKLAEQAALNKALLSGSDVELVAFIEDHPDSEFRSLASQALIQLAKGQTTVDGDRLSSAEELAVGDLISGSVAGASYPSLLGASLIMKYEG